MRPIALFSATAALLSCGTAPGGSGTVSVSDLCAAPGAFYGRRVRVAAAISSVTVCTALGCNPDFSPGGCCNVCWTTFTFDCGGGARIDLAADPSAGFPTVRGVPVEPNTNTAEIDYLIAGASTDFGCVGQDCAPVCTPAPAADILEVEGTFRAAGSGGYPVLFVDSYRVGP